MTLSTFGRLLRDTIVASTILAVIGLTALCAHRAGREEAARAFREDMQDRLDAGWRVLDDHGREIQRWD